MATEIEADSVIVDADGLEKLVVDLFRTQGLSERNARDASAVLIKADVLGIESHGVPRLRNYITRLQNGQVESNPEVVVVREMPLDGAGGRRKWPWHGGGPARYGDRYQEGGGHRSGVRFGEEQLPLRHRRLLRAGWRWSTT